jgi:hypothetical protein
VDCVEQLPQSEIALGLAQVPLPVVPPVPPPPLPVAPPPDVVAVVPLLAVVACVPDVVDVVLLDLVPVLLPVPVLVVTLHAAGLSWQRLVAGELPQATRSAKPGTTTTAPKTHVFMELTSEKESTRRAHGPARSASRLGDPRGSLKEGTSHRRKPTDSRVVYTDNLAPATFVDTPPCPIWRANAAIGKLP